MKGYYYMYIDVGTDETHIEMQEQSYKDNTFIQNTVNINRQTGYHEYDYYYYPQEYTFNDTICRSFPKDQVNVEGDVITLDNPVYIIKDLNTRENGTPIYHHLD